jgi:hypothetical protein
MNKATKILLFVFCISLFSCKKKVDENYRPEFIGKWDSSIPGEPYNHITLDITKDSQADYMIYWEGNDHHHTGTARANDDHLKIGRVLYLKIVEYPHQIDTAVDKHYVTSDNGTYKLANWKMTLNGIKPDWLLKLCFKTDYYKADY